MTRTAPRRWWWLPVLLVVALGAGTVVAYRVWSDRSYSATRMDCHNIDVRPVARLTGTGPVVPVDEDPDNAASTCAFHISGGAGTDLGIGLIVIVAATYPTREQAKADFERQDQPAGNEVNGIGERARTHVMPVTSDAPQVMTNYLLQVLDRNLVLEVSLQVFSDALAADQTAVQRELVGVARRAMSTLD